MPGLRRRGGLSTLNTVNTAQDRGVQQDCVPTELVYRCTTACQVRRTHGTSESPHSHARRGCCVPSQRWRRHHQYARTDNRTS